MAFGGGCEARSEREQLGESEHGWPVDRTDVRTPQELATVRELYAQLAPGSDEDVGGGGNALETSARPRPRAAKSKRKARSS